MCQVQWRHWTPCRHVVRIDLTSYVHGAQLKCENLSSFVPMFFAERDFENILNPQTYFLATPLQGGAQNTKPAAFWTTVSLHKVHPFVYCVCEGRPSYGETEHDASCKFKGERDKNPGSTNKYTKFGQLIISGKSCHCQCNQMYCLSKKLNQIKSSSKTTRIVKNHHLLQLKTLKCTNRIKL